MLNIFKNTNKQELTKNETNLLVKQFNGLNIQVYGTYEEPLFKAKDIKKIRTTLDNLDDECKVLKGAHTNGGVQQQIFLTEEGLLYQEKQFQDWVFYVIKTNLKLIEIYL